MSIPQVHICHIYISIFVPFCSVPFCSVLFCQWCKNTTGSCRTWLESGVILYFQNLSQWNGKTDRHRRNPVKVCIFMSKMFLHGKESGLAFSKSVSLLRFDRLKDVYTSRSYLFILFVENVPFHQWFRRDFARISPFRYCKIPS